MARLEDLTTGTRVTASGSATVESVQWIGERALKVIFRDGDGDLPRSASEACRGRTRHQRASVAPLTMPMIAFALWCLALLLVVPATVPADTGDVGTVMKDAVRLRSSYLDEAIVVFPGVFHPQEAEKTVLPLLHENPEVVRDKVVLEIGTGSGIISLYAAQLGAKRVVATDINKVAVATARRNAKALGFASRMDVRLVPAHDMSAYSVIHADEAFDVIISNPPYSLDLDASRNDAVTDTGDLGFSIVRGLDDHLTPGGVAVLLYGSLFYHEVMVKFARHMGFEVRHDPTPVLTPWEAGTLFNSYLARLLEREDIDPQAFEFDWREEDALQLGIRPPRFQGALDRLKWILVGGRGVTREPLFPGGEPGRYPGFIVIRRPTP